ncbi:cupin domain-containing protein [Pedobacter antarcticus]|uniref:cupin domain-containing protein n=1 Tax=Pedobacter antarcticus TaxID=34086 RepID=UPI001C55FC11|nr:cupin domain-containing protein [Pedobacter antarcticus]
MEINKVNLPAEVDQLKELWTLKELVDVNDHVVNLIKIKGEFEMHTHENGAKLFYVLEGLLFIAFADGDIIEVKVGEFVVIPKGAQQKPYALEETTILFFEPKR